MMLFNLSFCLFTTGVNPGGNGGGGGQGGFLPALPQTSRNFCLHVSCTAYAMQISSGKVLSVCLWHLAIQHCYYFLYHGYCSERLSSQHTTFMYLYTKSYLLFILGWLLKFYTFSFRRYSIKNLVYKFPIELLLCIFKWYWCSNLISENFPGTPSPQDYPLVSRPYPLFCKLRDPLCSMSHLLTIKYVLIKFLFCLQVFLPAEYWQMSCPFN